jgi:phosphate uptake regulator
MGTRNIPIHQGIISMQVKLTEQVVRIKEMYSLLKEDLSNSNVKRLKEVIRIEDMVNITRDKIESDAIYELTKSVFAKDLRRIVAYLQINDKLEQIADQVSNIYEFIDLLTKKHKLTLENIETKVFCEMIDKLDRRFKQVETLLVSEEETEAIKLIDGDSSINKSYKDIIEKLSTDKLIKGKVNVKTLSEVKLGFMLAVKNLERTGDNLKYIGKSILFISNIKK